MSDAKKPVNSKHLKRLAERGQGVGKHYLPFIFVHELSSKGESIRVKSATVGRVHHLLSGIEFAAFLIFDWCDRVIDIREQFPIPIEDTLIICQQLGIKHPQVRGELSVVTTDMLVDFKNQKSLAVAVKPSDRLGDKRTIEKLQIEKSYWESKGCSWKLFTDQEVGRQCKENLQWLRPYFDQDMAEAQQCTPADSQELIQRLAIFKDGPLTKLCATLDDQYELTPGYHVGVLRYAIANRHIKIPLEKVFHSLSLSDIATGDVKSIGEASYAS
ncbi:MAG: TnsA endonuclease N-terminal domain-containing protein [Motiliproteus sp.]|nr:TnsA endonuclease N-terminal domain-containing protein [Motiliproteus sp.]MCW9053793.1 TnsA endonuclease N-terminal domain-containing protein [Motiliproteus sp.]